MKVYFDGGLRKNMICIAEESGYVKVEKRKYDNDDYEWDALELALEYVRKSNELWRPHKRVELVGDNNQVIRWIQEENPTCGDSIIKQKCLEKLNRLRDGGTEIIASWIKRNENLAGRVLEYHTGKSNQPTEFHATWYECSRCVYVSLSEKEREAHFYNSHITNG